MRFFVKAIASGFAMSMGAAIFNKVSKKLGLKEDKAAEEDKAKSQADAKADAAKVDDDKDEAPSDV